MVAQSINNLPFILLVSDIPRCLDILRIGTSPLVNPTNDLRVPQEAVLWVKYPVVLIWKSQELAWDSLFLEHVECGEPFTDGNTVVKFVVNDKLGGSPVANKVGWTPFSVVLRVGDKGSAKLI